MSIEEITMSQFGVASAGGNYAGYLLADRIGFNANGSLWIGQDERTRFVMTPRVELQRGGGAEKTEYYFRTQRPRFNTQGQAHLSLRLPMSVQACDGDYRGDYVTEISMTGEETLALGVGLLLPGLNNGMAVREVGWELQAPGDARVIEAARGGMTTGGSGGGVARFEDLGDWLILVSGQQFLGIYWGRGCGSEESQQWCNPLGGEGTWAKLEDDKRAPYYRGWETHLRQWRKPWGWQARESARVLLQPTSEKLRLALCWHHGSDLALDGRDAAGHFSGVVVVTWASDLSVVRDRLKALESPIQPSAKGAAVVGYDYLEGTYRFRRTDKQCEITFPPDTLRRRALVRVEGPPAGALACAVDGRAVQPQLISPGRTDDPMGPHDFRPDGGVRPVLAALERPAEQVELAVQLSSEQPTRIEVAQTEGLSLSYLSQDDRQELLLFSSPRLCRGDELEYGGGDDHHRHAPPAEPGARTSSMPLGRLSLQDMRFRHLRPPQMFRSAVTCLPLYWYLRNAPSPWHSANQLEAWEIRRNGPDVVALHLESTNPSKALRSTFDVEITLSASGTLNLDVTAQLDIQGHFPLPELQFLNLFPENSHLPEEWTYDETLLAGTGPGGGFLHVWDNRGDIRSFCKADYSPPFFLAQYATRPYPKGTSCNLAVLVTECSPADIPLSYRPCGCWLDDHFQVVFPGGEPRIGASYVVRYRVAIWPNDAGQSRENMAVLARRSLASGRLEVDAIRNRQHTAGEDRRQ